MKKDSDEVRKKKDAERQKKWSIENPDKRKAIVKRHKPKKSEYDKVYHENNRAKKNAYQKEWASKNKDKTKARSAEWYKNNTDRAKRNSKHAAMMTKYGISLTD